MHVSIWGRRIVGILQIVGGTTGIFQTLPVLLSLSEKTIPVYTEVLICIASGLSIVAGVLVLEKHPRGLFISKLLQLMAIPVLFTPVFSYQLILGPLVRATVGTGAGVYLLWVNGLYLQFNPGHSAMIGLNLVALVMFLYLRRCSFDGDEIGEIHTLRAFD
jgi:hypothetical protein